MHSRLALLRKYSRLPTRRKSLVLEAVFHLLFARLILRLLPFRKLVWFLERAPKPARLLDRERAIIRQEIRWAIAVTAARLPGETVCFPRGIAAQAMLRRRGIPAKLYYGAASLSGKGLAAHVWVQDGDQGVVGHLEASRFKVLAVYPASA